MTNTPIYNLSKPAGTDYVDITVINGNTDKLEAAISARLASCATAAATTAKVATLTGYVRATGPVVAVKFTYAVPANATLNINSTGAAAIYCGGAAVTATQIPAGHVGLFVFDGTHYNLLNPAAPDVTGKADKAVPAAANNVALLGADGNLVDSGKAFVDAEVFIAVYGTTTSDEIDDAWLAGKSIWVDYGGYRYQLVRRQLATAHYFAYGYSNKIAYVRCVLNSWDAGDASFICQSGGVVSGNLSLTLAPTGEYHATNKAYVDAGLAEKVGALSGTLTIPIGTSWTADSATGHYPYKVTVTATGMTAALDFDITCVATATDKDTNDARQAAWSCVKAIGQAAGALTFYADEAPAVACPVTWKAVL